MVDLEILEHMVAFALSLWFGLTSLSYSQAAPENHFTLGLGHYQKGQWSDAIQEFEKSLALDSRHAATHLNLGLALTQAGQYGRALGHLRRAQWLQPTLRPVTRAIRHLEQKKPELFISTSDSSFALIRRAILSRLNLDAVLGILLFTTLVAGWFMARYFGMRYRALVRELPLPQFPVFGAFFTAVWILLAGLTAMKIYDHTVPRATVIAAESAVRTAPLADSASIFKLPEGAEVEIETQKDGWLQVEIQDGSSGWISTTEVLITGGGLGW